MKVVPAITSEVRQETGAGGRGGLKRREVYIKMGSRLVFYTPNGGWGVGGGGGGGGQS